MSLAIGWFSAGVTSAVAISLALKKYENMQIYYFETGSHHPDNLRFIKDCEEWYGQKIHVLQSAKYKSVDDLIVKRRYLNGPAGALCTTELKKHLRQEIEKYIPFDAQVFGFDYSKKEIARAERFSAEYPTAKPVYPLLENKLTKEDCMSTLASWDIELPAMYKLGYHNNNCIGCVKGGMGYWNKIRADFPDTFATMAKRERELNHSCIRGRFLDELDPNAGRHDVSLVESCGVFCEPANYEALK